MSVIRILLLIFIASNLLLPSYAKSDDKLDVNSKSFMDLGRYVETLEINDSPEVQTEEKDSIDDYIFEEEARLDVAKRYEKNAVELNLNDDADNAMDIVNSDRVFKLKVNETQYKIEQDIKSENMIWDSSKAFTQAFLTDSRHMAPIPGVINSQSIDANVSPYLSASLGQTFLFDSNGPSVLFVRANESTYNTGSIISYKGDAINLSVGSFSSSYNHAASGGAILSTNSINLPKNAGSFVLGGAYFSNEAQDYDKTTGGGFVEYTFKRLKLNAQIGQSKYTNSVDFDTSLYFIPEFRISKSLYLKTRFIRNVSQNTMQDEFVLTYKPIKCKNNLEIELNATNQYTNNNTIKQRLKISTSFKI